MPEPRLPSVSPNRSRDRAPTRPTPVRPWFWKFWPWKLMVCDWAAVAAARLAAPASIAVRQDGRMGMGPPVTRCLNARFRDWHSRSMGIP